METPQTVLILSTSLLLAQGNLFSALGYKPWPLAQRTCSMLLDIHLQILLKFKNQHAFKVLPKDCSLFFVVPNK
jgi:hypothetical protein